ncbi:MAG: hypothetical protein M3680_08815 [Myxococcota bacterium]|nr:hypothetical protein [Myxococcota bacterium]
MRALLALVTLIALASPARADRELCVRGAVHRGPTLDLDVKGADLRDVFRLLSDVGRVNLVVPDGVAGAVTLRLRRVPWQQIACTIAAIYKLTIRVNGNVLLVQRRGTG